MTSTLQKKISKLNKMKSLSFEQKYFAEESVEILRRIQSNRHYLYKEVMDTVFRFSYLMTLLEPGSFHFEEKSPQNAMEALRNNLNSVLEKGGIVIPTESNLSALQLVQARSQSIYFIGLVPHVTFADGFPLSSAEYLLHDFAHTFEMIRADRIKFPKRFASVGSDTSEVKAELRRSHTQMNELVQRVKSVENERIRAAIVMVLHEMLHENPKLGKVTGPFPFDPLTLRQLLQENPRANAEALYNSITRTSTSLLIRYGLTFKPDHAKQAVQWLIENLPRHS